MRGWRRWPFGMRRGRGIADRLMGNGIYRRQRRDARIPQGEWPPSGAHRSHGGGSSRAAHHTSRPATATSHDRGEVRPEGALAGTMMIASNGAPEIFSMSPSAQRTSITSSRGWYRAHATRRMRETLHALCTPVPERPFLQTIADMVARPHMDQLDRDIVHLDGTSAHGEAQRRERNHAHS